MLVGDTFYIYFCIREIVINIKKLKTMKKSLLTIALLMMFSLSARSQQNWGGYFPVIVPECVQFLFYDDVGSHPKDHRDSTSLPVLGYNGNTFVLATPYELENVTIVIRDEDGIVLYYNTVSSITDYYMFQLSNDVIAEMFSIELYYGDYHLYGEF
jgi:hypothetical protein